MAVTNGTTLARPAAADPSTLPPADSPTIKLVRLEDDEKEDIWILNGQTWKGPITLEAYIRREHFLAKEPLTRDGGISYWALVDTASTAKPRTILSSCESLRKYAVSVRRGGQIEEEITHGIGSVFCREEYRGHGYAARMMQELGKILETWQQHEGKKAKFSLLWSDIGKVRFNVGF
jgi:GNAT superfamily N-acetyltransferase